jgi:Uri superfamily endonuclease
MDKGIYCLVLRNPACTVTVGALGSVAFTAGFHVYVGSAQGGGGLKRVRRHILLAQTKDRRPKWHIDYLLTSDDFGLCSVVCASTAEKFECRLAQTLPGSPVPFFGCSDCSCGSHLLHSPDDPQDRIMTAFRDLGLPATIKTIITHHANGNL